eukprot:9764686-Lingulodinium_polyedra.AAC.1
MAQVAQGVDPGLPPRGAAARAAADVVYSDGACYDPPRSARGQGGLGHPCPGQGRWRLGWAVQGAQTAQR